MLLANQGLVEAYPVAVPVCAAVVIWIATMVLAWQSGKRDAKARNADIERARILARRGDVRRPFRASYRGLIFRLAGREVLIPTISVLGLALATAIAISSIVLGLIGYFPNQ